jgi:glycosyltransferase involved in cell wall biosynthesis
MSQDRPRILHAPAPVGRSAWKLSRAERALGYHSDCMLIEPGPINCPSDYCLDFHLERNRWRRYLRMGRFFLHSLFSYDVFHFHTDLTLLPRNIDLPLLRLLGKKIFFHFHGIEILKPGQMPAHCQGADGYFVSTPNLLKIVPQAVLIPQQIDLENFPAPPPHSVNGKIKVLHGIITDDPYRRQVKGTDHILDVFEQIARERSDVEFKFVSDLSHAQLLAEISQVDIVVDQLVVGWYGNIAVEAMALGKVVLNWIEPDLARYVPAGCPIVQTSKETLYDDVLRLLDAPEQRTALAARGRSYVEQTHSVRSIAERLICHYVQAGSPTAPAS